MNAPNLHIKDYSKVALSVPVGGPTTFGYAKIALTYPVVVGLPMGTDTFFACG